MACNHKKQEPIAEWYKPRRKTKGVQIVEGDHYALWHCRGCGGVSLRTHNDYCYASEPITGRLKYSFERAR